MSPIPKRLKKTHNSTSRKRAINKAKRQAGLEYIGFSVSNNKIKQNSIKMPRKMGRPCTSPFCADYKVLPRAIGPYGNCKLTKIQNYLMYIHKINLFGPPIIQRF